VVKKIEVEINYDDAFIMLGIVSTNTDYQLAHFINKAIDTHFSKYEDFVFNGNGKKKYPYSWYYCFSEDLKVKAYLIANHHRAKKLLPEYKQIDYFIVLENNIDAEQLNSIVNSIRGIRKVTAVFKLDLSKIKNVDLLLQENEMHEMNFVK